MLKSFKKSREQKTTQKAEEFLRKGIVLLDGKLYKQAMIEFQNAFQLEPKTTYERLDKEFKHYLEIFDHEAALSIGLILIKINKNDYELVNTIGNCARRQKNYKQANNLYRHALKINKNYPTAFYNLAASMGKIEKYDLDIKQALEVFSDIKDYILPEFYDDPEFKNTIIKQFVTERSTIRDDRIRNLEGAIKAKEEENELQEARVLKMELEQEKKATEKPMAKDYRQFYEKLIKENEDGETKKIYKITQRNLYNFAIYALQNEESEIAMEIFSILKEQGNSIKYLDMLTAIAMAKSKKIKEGIDFFVKGLGQEQYNRFFNINLGMMYKSIGNRLLSTKYLTIGAELLEKSDGLYHLSDLINIADKNMAEGNNRKALKLYKVAVSEVDDTSLWANIGEIYINLKKYDDATKAFREILKIEPESKIATDQLKQLHDIFCARAEGFFHQSKYQAAASMYEKALRILRPAETLKQTASIYKVLNNTDKVEELNKEYEEIQKKERDAETEKERQAHIKKGKMYIKRKNFNLGVEHLETAFRMKLDRDVFVLLASIYKSLKRREAIQDLLEKWNRMVEYEEKMKKFEKDQERAQTMAK